ncbi:unnamed protein product [Aureobasidium mustum]|uniref:F-box domain-containing protein n=1 Tax=Aureobasidium mustum TaxID=2773714 RepID=A0A9N8PL78_9PEZI|nr:unnamed protein product [Aureobasidium mustum]
MAEEIFGNPRGQSMQQRTRRRRGNHFASFTKKFSLGNDLITKEGGKMLGTLVAVAVARMRSLESFTWDMPTGVLSAVWDALSSLADHGDDKPCRLERVAVRWHDNDAEPRSAPAPIPYQEGDAPPRLSALNHVENPSFSILPPLKSLSVLDIDEVQYLDELSVLIHRSVDKLRELRIGIANLAKHKEFNYVWEGEDFQQVDRANPVMSCITIGEKRLGGVLGILTGMIFDLQSVESRTRQSNRLRRRSNATIGTSQISSILDDPLYTPITIPASDLSSSGTAAASATDTLLEVDADDETIVSVEHIQASPKTSTSDSAAHGHSSTTFEHSSITLPHRLKDSPDKQDKNALELEDVPLSIPVMLNAIDWSALTTLTLLHCYNHELLWKALRRQFAPSPSTKPRYVTGMIDSSSQPSSRQLGSEKTYKLNLKHISTDTVSSSLISFIKETLQPNSLESVFFLHTSTNPASVSLDAIFNSVLRRHRTSLSKLLIESSERGNEDLPGASVFWRQWMFSREIIKFLGKMPCLRELGAALDYRDWVVDIVALRPELGLCYLGIMKKCFEILEQKPGSRRTDHSRIGVGDDSGSEDEDDDDEGSVVEDEYDVEYDDDNDSEDSASDSADSYEDSELGQSDNEKELPSLRLREILYYDDKVSIFKARHARL